MNDHLGKKGAQKKIGLILIGIALVICLIFGAWYLLGKNNSSNSNQNNEINSLTSFGSLEDEDASLNIFNAKFIFKKGYDDFSILKGFNLDVNIDDQKQQMNAEKAKIFWKDFEKNFGQPDLTTATFETKGNKVEISFKTLEKNLNFKRVITYGRAGQDYIVSADFLEKIKD